MKKLTLTKLIIFTVALLIIGTTTQIFGQVRVEPAPDKLVPRTPFDEATAKQALAEGTSVIKGVACSIIDRQTYFARTTKVKLYPDTPHLREWLKLGNDKGFNIVSMSPEAYKYRLEATTDQGGRFQFTKMKPGKYYLLAYYEVVFNDPFDERDYTVGRSLERFVEIKKDSEEVKIDLTSGVKAGFIRLKCRR